MAVQSPTQDQEPDIASQPVSPVLSWRHPYYWKVFLVGLLLYFISSQVLALSGNPNLVPTVILLGSFLVPVTFVTFLDENEIHEPGAFSSIILAFIFGGVHGTAAATLVEDQLVRSLAFPALLLIGGVEEFAKLLGVVWLVRRRQFMTEAYGIVFGAAAGMGFAALESMGYAMTFLILSRGNLAVLNAVIITRGILMPFGHGTWTAIVVSTIWRERSAGRSPIGLPVLAAFGTALLLHALWDYFAGQPAFDFMLPGVDFPLSLLVIGLISLGLLYQRMREARR